MLEDAAMTLLLDVLQIFARRPVGRILLTHVAESPGELGKSLAVGALAEPFHGKMRRFSEGRTRQNSDSRLCKNHGRYFVKRKSVERVSYWARSMSDSREVA